jgi:hypothetical protein
MTAGSTVDGRVSSYRLTYSLNFFVMWQTYYYVISDGIGG